MRYNKELRDKIGRKYRGLCAYCGRPLGTKWRVHEHGETRKQKPCYDTSYPCCARCVVWMAKFGVEGFRQQVYTITQRLKISNAQYRMALIFGQIKEQYKEVKFYFETVEPLKEEDSPQKQ